MLEQIKKIICNFVEIDPDEITEKSILRTEIGLNSLDCVSLAQELEAEYGASIPNKAITSFKTVGDIIDYVEKKN